MSKENNRIYFTNSPFPNGHKVVYFNWSMRLDSQLKLWMDLHLESDNYDEEEEYFDDVNLIDEPSEQESEKSLWFNYNQCIMSSTYWKNKGIDLNHITHELDFNRLPMREFLVDPLPVDLAKPEELAFGISMLGNDTCANHDISFLKPFDAEDLATYDIKWKGKVANTYLGEENFDYEFYVYMKNIRFSGINIDPSLDVEKAFAHIKERFAPNADLMELVCVDEINDYYKVIIKR
ncbi:hypothetical protein [Vaginella massiliensis]|uniref:hypothetical protein n=1 Tax=Vaginella massiliensis TaxID=1816680 RepID=UPI0008389284|nr:hypothetical protein [Vaginella massiliensis]